MGRWRGDTHALFRENDSSGSPVNQGQERCSERRSHFPRVAHSAKPRSIKRGGRKGGADASFTGQDLDRVSFQLSGVATPLLLRRLSIFVRFFGFVCLFFFPSSSCCIPTAASNSEEAEEGETRTQTHFGMHYIIRRRRAARRVERGGGRGEGAEEEIPPAAERRSRAEG